MTRTLSALRGRFEEAARTSEAEIARRTDRIRDLEADNERLRAEVARLQRENARMEEAQDVPGARDTRGELEAQLRAVTEERDKLNKHVKKANRYIQSLLANNVRIAVVFSLTVD